MSPPNNPLDNFRWLIRTLKHEMDKELSKPKVDITKIFFDSHLWPQLWFLLHSNHSLTPLPFKYIGRLENMTETLPVLWAQFLSPKENEERTKEAVRSHLRRHRNRHSLDYSAASSEGMGKRNISSFNLKVADLDSEDIIIICHLYFLDYLCFPSFSLPEECSKEDLMATYYRFVKRS